MNLLYVALEEDSDTGNPVGWPDGWEFPDGDGPWPPGWPTDIDPVTFQMDLYSPFDAFVGDSIKLDVVIECGSAADVAAVANHLVAVDVTYTRDTSRNTTVYVKITPDEETDYQLNGSTVFDPQSTEDDVGESVSFGARFASANWEAVAASTTGFDEYTGCSLITPSPSVIQCQFTVDRWVDDEVITDRHYLNLIQSDYTPCSFAIGGVPEDATGYLINGDLYSFPIAAENSRVEGHAQYHTNVTATYRFKLKPTAIGGTSYMVLGIYWDQPGGYRGAIAGGLASVNPAVNPIELERAYATAFENGVWGWVGADETWTAGWPYRRVYIYTNED